MTDPQKQEGDNGNSNGNNNQVEIDREEEEDKSNVNPPNEEMVSEWVACDPIDTDLLGAVDATAIFDDVLPTLAEFPTMRSSSQSSSSSSPSTSSSACSSSCSSSPWSIKKGKNDNSGKKSGERPADSLAASSPAAQSTATTAGGSSSPMLLVPKQEPMDTVLDGFGGMGILDTVDISWEASMFQTDVNTNSSQEDENCFVGSPPTVPDNQNEGQESDSSSSQELAQVFFDWLRSNKESISPEDLRSIKLKKSTIESAVNRLGGGKNGMLQLLKLILTWVQNHHLQKKQKQYLASCDDISNMPRYYLQQQQQQDQGLGWPNTNSWCLPIAATPFRQSPAYDPSMPPFPTVVGFPSVDMGYGFASEPVQALPLSASPPAPCDNLVDAGSWPQAHQFYPDDPSLMTFAPGSSSNANYNSMVQQSGCMSKSATKEARKKRMARQRRFLFHHRHSNVAEKAMVMEFNSGDGNGTSQSDCMLWPSSSPPVNPSPEGQQTFHRLAPVDRQQGSKTEKNLRFLLQKVLKQSDVGNLGRIVLPKEAEMHLPELEARDGISITMEDVGTSRVWNMRYRFWPNNKSRMYLLENTGDFVRSNGLQEGDFIVIYSDVKSGKYLIRGVKVPCQGADNAQTKVQKTIARKPFKPTAMDVSSSSNTGPVPS
ncbi:unnamed protein product [Victoria cruziana]